MVSGEALNYYTIVEGTASCYFKMSPCLFARAVRVLNLLWVLLETTESRVSAVLWLVSNANLISLCTVTGVHSISYFTVTSNVPYSISLNYLLHFLLSHK